MEASDFGIASDGYQKSEEFKKKLMNFMCENGYDSFKVPQIAGRELDLYKLYTSVIRRGGYDRVSALKLWREIVNEFKLPDSCTSASFTLRTHYQKYLYAYEKKYFSGNTNDGLTNFTVNKFQSGLPQIYPVPTEINLNLKSKSFISRKIRLSQTEAESKRLVLAFESRIPSEIKWALNTLCIFSCNVSAPFTLDSQPFLLDSMCAYVRNALSKIPSLDYTNLIEKLDASIMSSVPTMTESSKPMPQSLRIAYKSPYPSFSDRMRRREETMQEMQRIDEPVTKGRKTRGRKRKNQMIEQQRLLDDMRIKRRRKVNMLHVEESQFELIENIRIVIHILRNLSFVKMNEHQLMKCPKLIDIIITLFTGYIDKEITHNCLDILTSLAKHIVLKETIFGEELVKSLFEMIKTTSKEQLLDEAIECLRRLCLSSGNDEYIEKASDEDIRIIINCLLFKNMETREAALEILCYISDRKIETKIKIANQKNCIKRLVALIAAGSHTPGEERVSKLAALTLSNLNMVTKNKKLITPYEQELALIAASDENISKIVSELLGDLDSFQVSDTKLMY